MRDALKPWDLHSPQETMDHIASTATLRDGDVIVAMVTAQEDGAREVMDVRTIHSGPEPTEPVAHELIREHANLLAGRRPWSESGRGGAGGWSRPPHVMVTVVCRSGMVVPSPTEHFWLMAWRYSNHLANTFDGDVYVMTEHGWTGYLDRRAGLTPTISRRRAMSVVPAPR